MFGLLGSQQPRSASSLLCSGDAGINGTAGTLAMGPLGGVVNLLSGGMLNNAMQGVQAIFGR